MCGGEFNSANGVGSSVSGTTYGLVTGEQCCVNGGSYNGASTGDYTSITGGNCNSATGEHATIVGGASIAEAGTHTLGSWIVQSHIARFRCGFRIQ